ncbi:MAG: hypothetical protein ACT4P6_17480, partial [Gemmatimonadaceae bacterium]
FTTCDALAQQSERLKIDTAELGARLRHLSADSMEGRYPGTRGEARTTAYLIKELTAFGVKPSGHGWLAAADHDQHPSCAPQRGA